MTDATLVLVGGEAVPLKILRHPRARAYRLRVDRDGAVRLTCPARGSQRRAIEWARQQSEWIAAELARRHAAGCRLADGATFPLDGTDCRIVATAGPGRRIMLEQGQLIVGGPAEHVGPRVLRWLKSRARVALSEETMRLARQHGLPLGRVSIGDPAGRWGSCTARGDIRYSWRLIMAPPEVRISTVAHEVAHLRHMDHSPAFHAFHRLICPSDTVAARAWLRSNGAALHAVGV